MASRRPLGRVEATTVLAALVVLFAAFAASQVATVVGGAEYVRRTAGLSYADYARNGFFQLLAVAAITLAVLLAIRATTGTANDDAAGQRRFTVLAEAAIVLTFVLIAGAVRRLALYEQAYGLTMLRLYSLLFALWIGAVFALLAVSIARPRTRNNWLAPAAIAMMVAGLVALGAANPEAIVVHRNVDRFAATKPERLDVGYLATLSDDAVPAIVEALPKLDDASATPLREATCRGPRDGAHAPKGFWAFNFGADAARDARKKACDQSV